MTPLFFSDDEYVRAVAGRVTATLGHSLCCTFLLDLALSPSGQQLAWSQDPVSVLDLVPGTMNSLTGFHAGFRLYWASNGKLYGGEQRGLTAWEADGGRAGSLSLYGFRFMPSRFSEGLMIEQGRLSSELARFELDGGRTLLFSSQELNIYDAAEEPSENVLFVNWSSTSVHRLRLDQSPPVVETAFELSDRPSSVAVSPDGGIYIGVSSAILRAR